MKRKLLVFAFAIISTTVLAQTAQTPKEKPADYVSQAILTPLETAIDFSVTFTDGTPVNLFATCDAGNSVVLDFFFVSCGYCQSYAPIIDQAYVTHGAGTGNIKFWGIDNGDNNAQVIAYKSTYGVTNPCASGTQGGGNAVCSTYSSSFAWSGYPTYSIVCPDRTYSHDINYPPTATGFNSYFATCGTTSVDENYNPAQTIITYMYPMPAQDNMDVHIYVDKTSQIKIELFDILGNSVYAVNSSADMGYFNAAINVNSFAAGTYFIKLSQNDVVKDVQKIIVVN